VVGEVEGSEVGEGTRTGDTTPRKLEKSREVRYGNLWKMRVRDTDGFRIEYALYNGYGRRCYRS
jgi:hypothetical protein